MTHILDFAKPNRSFLLFKPDRHQVREGDTVIFQSKELIGDTGVQETVETTVTVTHVDAGSGIHKGYQLIGWEDKTI